MEKLINSTTMLMPSSPPGLHLVTLAIRMGFAYANEHIIQHMNNVKAPYNVNRLSQEVAVRALADQSLYQENITAILKVCTNLFVYSSAYFFRGTAEIGIVPVPCHLLRYSRIF